MDTIINMKKQNEKKGNSSRQLNNRGSLPISLKSVTPESFDGIVCSNVLDVAPMETSREIVKELARIAENEAKIVIGLNFYMSKDMAEKRKIELVEDKYLFSDGVLRLTSLSDDEWKDIFTQYFAVENLDHFAWPGEEKETRRLFLLTK